MREKVTTLEQAVAVLANAYNFLDAEGVESREIHRQMHELWAELKAELALAEVSA